MAPRRILKRFRFTALVATIVARFSRSLNSPCRLTGPDGEHRDRIWLGNYGERVAADSLRAGGCRILAKNFRGPRRGEVDIVARDGKLLLFIEVKTRREGGVGRPLDAVNSAKLELIERGANSWLKLLKNRRMPWRFDVIEIILTEGEKPHVNRVENVL